MYVDTKALLTQSFRTETYIAIKLTYAPGVYLKLRQFLHFAQNLCLDTRNKRCPLEVLIKKATTNNDENIINQKIND